MADDRVVVLGLARVKKKPRSGRGGLWIIWNAMIRRCHNPKTERYPYYGGRGIKVCDRWRESLDNFIADMGPRPGPKHSLDRIDNDGDYEPSNCRWATDDVQRRNRSDNRHLTFQGRTMVLEDWATETGIKVGTIWARLKTGWSVERALTEQEGSAQRRYIEWRGERRHIGDWARHLSLQPMTLVMRLRNGWSVENALTRPVKARRK